MTQEIMTFINDNIFGVWFSDGAALVFWCRQVSQWWRQVSPEQKIPVTF